MKRGEVSEEDSNPRIGVKPSTVCERQYGREGFTCPTCGTFTTLRGQRVKPEVAKAVRTMVQERYCMRCRRYADGRVEACKKLPGGPGTTCKGVWPNIPSAWCAGCRE